MWCFYAMYHFVKYVRIDTWKNELQSLWGNDLRYFFWHSLSVQITCYLLADYKLLVQRNGQLISLVLEYFIYFINVFSQILIHSYYVRHIVILIETVKIRNPIKEDLFKGRPYKTLRKAAPCKIGTS